MSSKISDIEYLYNIVDFINNHVLPIVETSYKNVEKPNTKKFKVYKQPEKGFFKFYNEILLRCGEIPPIFDTLIEDIAKTGVVKFPWIIIRFILILKTESVLQDVYAIQQSNTNQIETLKIIFQSFWNIVLAPLGIRRFCELLINPRKHYKDPEKFTYALVRALSCISIALNHHITQEVESYVIPASIGKALEFLNPGSTPAIKISNSEYIQDGQITIPQSPGNLSNPDQLELTSKHEVNIKLTEENKLLFNENSERKHKLKNFDYYIPDHATELPSLASTLIKDLIEDDQISEIEESTFENTNGPSKDLLSGAYFEENEVLQCPATNEAMNLLTKSLQNDTSNLEITDADKFVEDNSLDRNTEKLEENSTFNAYSSLVNSLYCNKQSNLLDTSNPDNNIWPAD